MTIHTVDNNESFLLDSFFPYQVRIFYSAVSQAVRDIYTSRYGLSVSEWRTLVVLGDHQPLSASEVVECSSIDKVQVSRAIQGLLKRALVTRAVDLADRRRVNLTLTSQGQAVYNDLIPRVRELETELLAELSPDERTTLLSLMSKVRRKAEQINRDTLNSSVPDNNYQD